MAYPVIDLPMFRPLIDLSAELFCPDVNLVPPNSITLLETNPRFIESYLVGLNHEMARELLWREYPTDQRGTPFRQFWDTHTVLPLPGESADARRERLYDIKPIDKWPALTRSRPTRARQERSASPGPVFRNDARALGTIFVVLRCPLDRQEPALAPLHPDLGFRLQFEGRLIQTSEPNLDERVTVTDWIKQSRPTERAETTSTIA